MGKLVHLLCFALAALGVGIAFLGMWAGCGPPGGYITYPETGATLEGTVTYDGQPVGVAMIIVRQDGPTGPNNPVVGFLGDEGRYKLENVPLGEVQVGVNTAAAKGPAMGKMMSQTQGKGKRPMKIIDIPGKYGDPVRSGLSTVIQKGPNVFDIVIQK